MQGWRKVRRYTWGMFTPQENTFQLVFLQAKNYFLLVRQRFSWREALYLSFLIVGLASICFGIWRIWSAGTTEYVNDQETPEIKIVPELVVEVAGAVEKPGVYTLPIGSRVAQAITMAGNTTIDVDAEYLAQKVNLAEELKDQQKIYLPFYIESNDSDSDVSNDTQSEKISINSASLSQLMELEGIGDKRAEAIIDGRPYQSLEALVSQKILTELQLDKVKKLITL